MDADTADTKYNEFLQYQFSFSAQYLHPVTSANKPLISTLIYNLSVTL